MGARQLLEYVILRSQIVDVGGAIRGTILMEIERDSRIEQQASRPLTPTEGVGAAHPVHQFGGDRRAELVARKGLERTGVPRPLLEHLARRLDEVPLGLDATQGDPLAA